MTPLEFDALGKEVRRPSRRLEVFPKPAGVEKVVMESDEVTSLCPVTGQPDWETVTISFAPDELCLESKSLKLYLWSYRDQGVFCEAMAAQIAQHINESIHPHWISVTVTQKPRGGVKITATAILRNSGEDISKLGMPVAEATVVADDATFSKNIENTSVAGALNSGKEIRDPE